MQSPWINGTNGLEQYEDSLRRQYHEIFGLPRTQYTQFFQTLEVWLSRVHRHPDKTRFLNQMFVRKKTEPIALTDIRDGEAMERYIPRDIENRHIWKDVVAYTSLRRSSELHERLSDLGELEFPRYLREKGRRTASTAPERRAEASETTSGPSLVSYRPGPEAEGRYDSRSWNNFGQSNPTSSYHSYEHISGASKGSREGAQTS